jgi:hypothetical protein
MFIINISCINSFLSVMIFRGAEMASPHNPTGAHARGPPAGFQQCEYEGIIHDTSQAGNS